MRQGIRKKIIIITALLLFSPLADGELHSNCFYYSELDLWFTEEILK